MTHRGPCQPRTFCDSVRFWWKPKVLARRLESQPFKEKHSTDDHVPQQELAELTPMETSKTPRMSIQAWLMPPRHASMWWKIIPFPFPTTRFLPLNSFPGESSAK